MHNKQAIKQARKAANKQNNTDTKKQTLTMVMNSGPALEQRIEAMERELSESQQLPQGMRSRLNTRLASVVALLNKETDEKAIHELLKRKANIEQKLSNQQQQQRSPQSSPGGLAQRLQQRLTRLAAKIKNQADPAKKTKLEQHKANVEAKLAELERKGKTGARSLTPANLSSFPGLAQRLANIEGILKQVQNEVHSLTAPTKESPVDDVTMEDKDLDMAPSNQATAPTDQSPLSTYPPTAPTDSAPAMADLTPAALSSFPGLVHGLATIEGILKQVQNEVHSLTAPTKESPVDDVTMEDKDPATAPRNHATAPNDLAPASTDPPTAPTDPSSAPTDPAPASTPMADLTPAALSSFPVLAQRLARIEELLKQAKKHSQRAKLEHRKANLLAKLAIKQQQQQKKVNSPTAPTAPTDPAAAASTPVADLTPAALSSFPVLAQRLASIEELLKKAKKDSQRAKLEHRKANLLAKLAIKQQQQQQQQQKKVNSPTAPTPPTGPAAAASTPVADLTPAVLSSFPVLAHRLASIEELLKKAKKNSQRAKLEHRKANLLVKLAIKQQQQQKKNKSLTAPTAPTDPGAAASTPVADLTPAALSSFPGLAQQLATIEELLKKAKKHSQRAKLEHSKANLLAKLAIKQQLQKKVKSITASTEESPEDNVNMEDKDPATAPTDANDVALASTGPPSTPTDPVAAPTDPPVSNLTPAALRSFPGLAHTLDWTVDDEMTVFGGPENGHGKNKNKEDGWTEVDGNDAVALASSKEEGWTKVSSEDEDTAMY